MTTKSKAVILISGGGSNLQAFIDQVDAGQLDVDIALVISNVSTAYGLKRAANAGIEHHCIDHRNYASRLDFDKALINHIDLVEPNIVILAGFMRILTPEFVHHYANRLINIHPSLLPKFTGVNTHQRALDAEEKWHGASIHFVIPELDAGPVILQGQIEITADDTKESLQSRIHKIEHELYPLAVNWFTQGRLTIENGKVLLDGEISSEQLQTFDH
ncbi:phosphoribosylglycinamide formyltransferase [Arenicella sp. 4NH20-0111]|uniref:phosphoribosylglycinamide formyltransferase n=1 Tax=Arenicella sp. 4NH20-0111 TaxID=3127648 RepID=UPI003108E3F2